MMRAMGTGFVTRHGLVQDGMTDACKVCACPEQSNLLTLVKAAVQEVDVHAPREHAEENANGLRKGASLTGALDAIVVSGSPDFEDALNADSGMRAGTGFVVEVLTSPRRGEMPARLVGNGATRVLLGMGQ